jgi:hypothetical protein
MAMRLFSKDEFEAYLRDNLSLTKTDQRVSSAVIWKIKDGQFILVPELDDGDRYPDYLLNDIYLQIQRSKS